MLPRDRSPICPQVADILLGEAAFTENLSCAAIILKNSVIHEKTRKYSGAYRVLLATHSVNC